MTTNALTVLAFDPEKGGKAGKGGGIKITNATFIAAVFPALPESAFAAVCCKPGNPGIGGWAANRADQAAEHLSAENNNYVACSSFLSRR